MSERDRGPWDDVSVDVTSRGVAAVRLDGRGSPARRPPSGRDDSEANDTTDDDPLATEALKQLREYLHGDRTRFELPLDLTGATPFRRSVFEALLRVPFGTTVSYKELARRVGCDSPRAVGQAVGSNPLAIIVPCHRVVTSDGRLGGYSGGLDRKVALLGIEGIVAGSDSFASRISPATSRISPAA